jgi:hypothetical protein
VRSPWQRAYAAASSRGRRRSRFRCPHTLLGHLPNGRAEGNPLLGGRPALCDENDERQDAAQRQLHGLQSLPDAT